MHPSHYVGAEIPILGANAHWDPRGEYFVAEGDESDGTLRFFHPEHALILNIEEEHLDYYADLDGDRARLFASLLEQTTRHGFLLRGRCECGAALRETRPRRSHSVFRRRRIIAAPISSCKISLRSFAFIVAASKLGEAVLNVPGRHNVSNALGVIALATEVGIPFEKIAASLRQFSTRAPAFRNQIRERTFSAGGRLRASSDGNSRHYRDRALDRAQARADDVSAASLLAHESVAERIRPRLRQRRSRLGYRCLCRRAKRRFPGVSGQTIVDEIVAHGHRGASLSAAARSTALRCRAT